MAFGSIQATAHKMNATEREPGEIVDEGFIIVGLPRTGTNSVAALLEQLGYGPACSLEIFSRKSWMGEVQWMINWIEFSLHNRGENQERIHRMIRRTFKHCKTLSGIPTFAFAKEFHQVFPNRTFILTTRAHPDVWFRSVKATTRLEVHGDPGQDVGLFLFHKLHPKGLLSEIYHRMTWSRLFQDWSEEYLVTLYEEWPTDIAEIVGKEKLIVLDVDSGDWSPLTDRLDLPNRDLVYPHVCSRNETLEKFESMSQRGYNALMVYLIVPIVFFYCMRRMRLL